MKTVVTIFSLLLAIPSFAETITCDAVDDGPPYVRIVHDGRQVSTIDEIYKHGSSRIFSRTYEDPSIRGGFSVSYCNPDESEIRPYNGNVNVYSICMIKTDYKVHFNVKVDRAAKTGRFSVTVLSEAMPVDRDVELKNCRDQ